MTLKYQSPVKAYGMSCDCMCGCEHGMKSVKVPLDLDRRLFVLIACSSYKWRRLYKGRRAAERVNSRFDVTSRFGISKKFRNVGGCLKGVGPLQG